MRVSSHPRNLVPQAMSISADSQKRCEGSVELDHVSCRFGSFRAIEDLSLTIRAGEFFSILGPSGCGKTTILRMISGFIDPSAGTIRIGGEDVRGKRANQRPTSLIFQNLALFPLMRVWENVAFGLEMRRVPRSIRRKRAEELLALVDLVGAEEKMISQLSGGQRQRVAIARALAVEPSVMLLDEPLSALDLKLRQHMRAELRSIQKRTGVTFIYITHDQSEALAMSDRVAVMNKGRMLQVAPPHEIYHNPSSGFVAKFVGETNVIEGKLVRMADGFGIVASPLGQHRARVSHNVQGESVALYVRPEHVDVSRQRQGNNAIEARLQDVSFEGSFALVKAVTAHGHVFLVATDNKDLQRLPGNSENVYLHFDEQQAFILQSDRDKCIT